VGLDRQAIERRDFPVGRRGYDPAAVDAHLRELAVEFEELQRSAGPGGSDPSLASAAGGQVQGIIAAAETAAADIERQALEAAGEVREAADRDAESTREEALRTARAHVAVVSEATAGLLERVAAMDAEVKALLDSLRSGAGRLAGDLAAVEQNMAGLYGRVDASEGRAADGEQPAPPAPEGQQTPSPAPRPSAPVSSDAAASGPEPAAAVDLDGARLVALNMALNGESRADTDRYLAEHFEVPDRPKLIEEVYAAIEG